MRKSVIGVSLAVLGLVGASPAKACDRPGTPDQVVAVPTSPTSINLIWRNTTGKAGGSEDIWFDIVVTDGSDHLFVPSVNINGGAEQRGVRYGQFRSYVFNGLVPGREYRFRMRARDEGGSGGCVSERDSNTAVAWTPTPQIDAKCAPYAARAVQQVQRITAHQYADVSCSASGPRWNPDKSAHYVACTELERNHQPDFTAAETAGRDDMIKRCVPSPGQCTRYFVDWRRGNDLVPLEWCLDVMGLQNYCAARRSHLTTAYPKSGGRAMICTPDSTKDTAGEQVEHIARGVEQGVQDAYVAAAPFLGPVSEGLACINGVIYACAVLALDTAQLGTGQQVAGLAGDAVVIATQAQKCASGDLGACAQIGVRGAARAGLNIPGKDLARIASAAQKCNANDNAACVELGEDAVDAAGLKTNSGSPPLPGVLHVTGKAVGGPQPPHDPGPIGPGAFVGVWDTHTSQNGHFRLTFSESSGVLVGKFEDLNGNAQYNGTLKQNPGTEVKSDFLYTYEQPATKGSGTGEFLVETNGKLIGKIVTNDNPPLKIGWWGNKTN